MHAIHSSLHALPHHRLPEGNNIQSFGFKTQKGEIRPRAVRKWFDDRQQGDASRGHQRKTFFLLLLAPVADRPKSGVARSWAEYCRPLSYLPASHRCPKPNSPSNLSTKTSRNHFALPDLSPKRLPLSLGDVF